MGNLSHSDALDSLFEAIMALETQEECYDFFEDLCTVPELKAISQRYTVAKLLLEGNVYSKIVAQTGASTATISRVNRSLSYGCDGYKQVLAKMEAKKEHKK
ncbi:MAG: hypothetical protein IKX27_07845 [Oscillospiraceae bacterium]|nr:hypothetical protein [Oscillospiraceae bacterium]